jgi:hypothetical protein
VLDRGRVIGHDALVVWRPKQRDHWPVWEAPADATRQSISAVLRMMAEHKVHPEMAVSWATSMVPAQGDGVASVAWSRLLSATTTIDRSSYLYGEADFAAWADDIDSA